MLDPLLEVGFETPLGFTSLLTDDDSGGETNARLVLDASGMTGPWLEALRIKARAFDQSAGHYALELSEAARDYPPAPDGGASAGLCRARKPISASYHACSSATLEKPWPDRSSTRNSAPRAPTFSMARRMISN